MYTDKQIIKSRKYAPVRCVEADVILQVQCRYGCEMDLIKSYTEFISQGDYSPDFPPFFWIQKPHISGNRRSFQWATSLFKDVVLELDDLKISVWQPKDLVYKHAKSYSQCYQTLCLSESSRIKHLWYYPNCNNVRTGPHNVVLCVALCMSPLYLQLLHFLAAWINSFRIHRHVHKIFSICTLDIQQYR